MTDADAWVVWSFEHDAWWGPARWGYVRELAQAGRYSEAEAREIEARANRYVATPHEKALSLADARRLVAAEGN